MRIDSSRISLAKKSFYMW